MINVLDLKPGDRLQLHEHVIAEVTQNTEDGMWVEVKYLEAPGQAETSSVALCHAQDIVAVLNSPQAI